MMGTITISKKTSLLQRAGANIILVEKKYSIYLLNPALAAIINY
jgi:hypothetical protein